MWLSDSNEANVLLSIFRWSDCVFNLYRADNRFNQRVAINWFSFLLLLYASTLVDFVWTIGITVSMELVSAGLSMLTQCYCAHLHHTLLLSVYTHHWLDLSLYDCVLRLVYGGGHALFNWKRKVNPKGIHTIQR